MVYLDTNVLIYSFINEDESKQKQSSEILENLIEKKILFLSPLVLQEMVYIMARLGVSNELITENLEFYSGYCIVPIDFRIILRSGELSRKINTFKRFNDAVHIIMAETYCEKLITFDRDFQLFKTETKLNIEILN